MLPLISVSALALAASPTLAKLVTFDNTRPRLDASGAILNAHDGTIRRYASGGPFFYHAMSYGLCNETGNVSGCNPCIYGLVVPNAAFAWMSSDLSSGSWTRGEEVFGPGSGVTCPTMFRSQAVYNAATNLYVVWANCFSMDNATCPAGFPHNRTGSSCYLTATAPSPGGPFTYRGAVVPDASLLSNASSAGFAGDFAMLADADGAGYVIFTHGGPPHVQARQQYVFRLTDDYLNFTADYSDALPGPVYVEAPAIFRRGDVYYALKGGCSCAGLYGAGVAVLTAPHPLGPWALRSSALDPGCPLDAMKQCVPAQVGPGEVCDPISQAQQNAVVEVPLVGGGRQYVWTGDQWQQSPDGRLGHDPQVWLPLQFEANGDIAPLSWVDRFTLDIDA